MLGENVVQRVAEFVLSETQLAQKTFQLSVAQTVINLILLITTVISVICAFRAYHHQKARAKKDAACELARYYAHDIIHRHTFVSDALTQAGITESIHNTFPLEDLKEFNYSEMECLLHRKGYTSAQSLDYLGVLDPVIIYQGLIQNANSIEERRLLTEEYLEKYKTQSGEMKTKIKNSSMLLLTFTVEVNMLLNDLEWFSMSCRYGLADEEMLYQSLHQTFLSQVWMMYPTICMRNKANEDKLFTNIIWLFNLWANRLRAIQKKAQKKAKKVKQEVDLKEQKLVKAKQKAQNVGPKVHSGKQLK